MDNCFCSMPLQQFTEELASAAPVPGGGGVSALTGALAAALGNMVGSLTVGKKKYAAVEEDLVVLMKRSDTLRNELLTCIDEDAVAFAPLAEAYRIPKEDSKRDVVLEGCLKTAAACPMKVLKLSCDVLELLKEFAQKGSVLAISDAATGAALCRAAIQGAAINVKVNTRLMKDREYASSVDAETASLTQKYLPMAEEIYSGVLQRLSE